MSADDEKPALRKRMRALRLVADQKQGPEAALELIRVFLPHVDALGLRPGTIVAGYWPIITEIDVRPLLARLAERGMTLALPVLVDRGQALLFRRWQPTADLEDGPLGTSHPSAAEPEVVPDVVFVPMLAYDWHGTRLGQGGGHYDRTLNHLRGRGPIIAIGVGYAAQRLARIPRSPHDEALDWVLTEDGLTKVPR